MAQEIKSLDSDMQMLVYENYSKFITATDTIRRMKSNVEGMGEKMERLLDTVEGISDKSDAVNDTLASRRQNIEELNGVRALLKKLQVRARLLHLSTRRIRIINTHGPAVRPSTRTDKPPRVTMLRPSRLCLTSPRSSALRSNRTRLA